MPVLTFILPHLALVDKLCEAVVVLQILVVVRQQKFVRHLLDHESAGERWSGCSSIGAHIVPTQDRPPRTILHHPSNGGGLQRSGWLAVAGTYGWAYEPRTVKTTSAHFSGSRDVGMVGVP